MKPALFTPAAEADVEEAFQWYESQRKGLGAAFRHAVDIAVAALESNPDGYTVIQPEHEARPSTEVPVWALLPCSRRSHRRGRLHSRETTSKDLALSLRPANNLYYRVVDEATVVVACIHAQNDIQGSGALVEAGQQPLEADGRAMAS